MGAVLALLGKVPFLVWPLLVVSLWGWNGNHKATSIKNEWELAKAADAIQARKDTEIQRSKETAARLGQEGVVSDLTERGKAAKVAAAVAAGNVERLRTRIAELSAGSGMRQGAGADTAGEATSRLGTVAGQCVERLAALEAAARRGYIAGNGCAASYDATEKALNVRK